MPTFTDVLGKSVKEMSTIEIQQRGIWTYVRFNTPHEFASFQLYRYNTDRVTLKGLAQPTTNCVRIQDRYHALGPYNNDAGTREQVMEIATGSCLLTKAVFIRNCCVGRLPLDCGGESLLKGFFQCQRKPLHHLKSHQYHSHR